MRQMLVYDPRIWKASGGDIARNRHCWQLGTLIEEYWADEYDFVADIRWPDGSETRGHFIGAMREANH